MGPYYGGGMWVLTERRARFVYEAARLAAAAAGAPIVPGGTDAPQVGMRKTFPNGNVAEWDGTGWKMVPP